MKAVPAQKAVEQWKLTMLVVVVLLGAFWAMTRHDYHKIVGYRDWVTLNYVRSVENWQRYGLLETRLAQIHTPYPAEPENWDVYGSRPAGRIFFVYLGFELFGNNPLYTLANRLYGPVVGLLSLVFYTFTPLIVYFSGIPTPEGFGTPLILLALILYLRTIRRPTWGTSVLWLLLHILGGYIIWYWFVFAGVLVLHLLIYHGWVSLRRYWPVWAGIGLSIAFDAAFYLWRGLEGSVDSISDAVLRRTGVATSEVAVERWGVQVANNSIVLLTPTLMLLAIIGVIWLVRRRRFFAHDDALLLVVFISRNIFNGVFWQAWYFHEYHIHHVAIPLAIWGSLGLRALLFAYGRPPRRAWIGAQILLISTFFIASIKWSSDLYAISKPMYVDWGRSIQDHTQTSEKVVANIYTEEPYLSYYARRPVQWEVPLEEVLDPARPDEWGVYLYCHPDWQNRQPDWSDVSASVLYIDEMNECVLVDLNP